MWKSDIPKTAFVTHESLFEYTRMPFRLTNMPAIFQRALDLILSKYKCKSTLVYIDDVIIFSNSVEDLIKHVDEISTALGKAGVSLRLKKSRFFSKTIEYLGFLVRPGTIELDEAST